MPSVQRLFPPIASKGSRYSKIEDRTEIATTNTIKIYAIFDGHGGLEISEELCKDFCQRLIGYLQKLPNLADTQKIKALLRAYFVVRDKELWDAIRPRQRKDPGSTAVLAIFLVPTNCLFLVHAGDSRAVLYKVLPSATKGTAVRAVELLSTDDHKPMAPGEKLRIEMAGGHVTKANRQSVERVDGILAVSRGFGDFTLKTNNNLPYDPIRGKVSAVPSIRVIKLKPGAEYRLILASDGLWDEMTNTQLAEYLTFPTRTQPDLAKKLVQYARSKGGDDDISIIGLSIKG